MELLQALGVDITVFFQFGLATLAFFSLSVIAFGPYTSALLSREQKTKGGEQAAEELTKQAQDLRSQFEVKARKINDEIKTIFDSYRAASNEESQALITKARAESQKLVDETRARVSIEVAEASKKMSQEVPQVAEAIKAKLLSTRGGS